MKRSMLTTRTRFEFIAILASAACVGSVVASLARAETVAKATYPLPGEWPVMRANGAMDGHAMGRGQIEQPQIAWRYFVGHLESLVALEPGDQNTSTSVPQQSTEAWSADNEWRARWLTPGPQGQVAGKNHTLAFTKAAAPIVPEPPGQPKVYVTATITYADVLSEYPGLEKIEFQSGFSLPAKNGEWQYGPGSLSAWKDGAWHKVWKTDDISHSFNPYPIVDDFDGDGELEVVVVPFQAMLIFNAKTGALEQKVEFTKGRSYGFLGVYDFNDDGSKELLIVSDFPKHIDVLGYREGKLELFWQHEIEMLIDDPHTRMHSMPEPVGDFNGDGRDDVLVNIFNEHGDEKWHMVMHDGSTGKTLFDLADEVAQGTADVDHDGCKELLTLVCEGQRTPEFGVIRIRSLRGDEPKTLWEGANMAWQEHVEPCAIHQQDHWQQTRMHPLVREIDDVPTMVLRSLSPGGGGVRLQTAKWSDGDLQCGMAIEGLDLDAIAIDANGALLVRCNTRPNAQQQLRTKDGRIVYYTTTDRSGVVTPPVVARNAATGRPVIVAQGSLDQLIGLTADGTEQSMKEIWRRSGKVAAIGPSRSKSGRQLVCSTVAPNGALRVESMDLSGGDPLWHRDFAKFVAGLPSWNVGGTLTCQIAHFTEAPSDVLLTLQRSVMHSEEAYAIAGHDGSLIWRRPRQIASRSCGGPFAIADFDGDGRDDAASFFPSIHYILNGRDGSDLIARENIWPEIPVKLVYWGQPVAGDFDLSGKPSLLFTTYARSMVGRVESDGALAWSDAYDEAARGMPAVGDFDGDGAVEAIFVGFRDGTRCYDTATGRVKWTLPLGAYAGDDAGIAAQRPPVDGVSGDVDSDGRDEALFVIGQQLYCLASNADGTNGRVLWTFDLPCTTSSPVLADVNGAGASGELSVLVMGVDGYLYCIQ